MNAKPKMIIGKLDADAADHAGLRSYRSAGFREELVRGMQEAKSDALARQEIARLEEKIARMESNLMEIRQDMARLETLRFGSSLASSV